jgi:hypothetical protein
MITSLKRTFRRLAIPFSQDYNRVRILQTIVAKKKAKTYLEIGVDQGKVFEIIHGPNKIGVDPVAPAKKVKAVLGPHTKYFQKTSDDFFDQDAKDVFKKRIDVAFIDGLHEYKQVLKDINNTLDYLADDGVIIVHDCSPWSKASAIRAFSFAEAKEIAQRDQYKDWDGGWTGDVWKAIGELKSTRDDLEIFVLDCDCGLGVIRKGSQKLIELQNIDGLEYEDLVRDKEKILNLKKPDYFDTFLKTL